MGSKKLEEKIEQKIHEELEAPIIQSIPEASIDTGGQLTEDDVRNAKDEFIRSPSMSGFDSDIRLAMLFMAVQESIEKSKEGTINSSKCNLCSRDINSERFATKFIESYNTEKIHQKSSIKISSIRSMAELLQRNWGNAIRNIINGIIIPIYEYFSMEPTDLNKNKKFPYIIKNNQIYHEDCYIKEVNN